MTDTIDFFPIRVERTDWGSDREVLATIRHQVFVVEQGVPEEEEIDGRDPEAIHWIARSGDGEPMGTARLLGNKVGRMAVLGQYRHRGVGSGLLRAIIVYARDTGLDTLTLAAQTHALPFYQYLGFTATGPEFDDAGIPHRAMTLALRRFDPPRPAPPADDAPRQPVAVHGSEDFAARALEIVSGAERSIRLFSHRLDPGLYDREPFCENIVRIATRHPNTEVMILVRDTSQLLRQSHQLVDLCLRLSSRVQLRRLNPERETQHVEFVVGDEESVLCNRLTDGYRGYYYRHAPQEARNLGQDFDALWECSEPDPGMRRLYL